MDIFGVLTMLGGLALFLFGMNTMGDGLSKASGGRLEAVLEKLTDNPFKAVLVGCGVTAVIQSSSATTVMVVGFVNSGIMKLSQAVGVIMGANIGTTVTSWILSLAGIESGNFFIELLKPTSFSPILALIGISFLMFSRKDRKKDIGLIFIGFAVLMFGMETMSGAVRPLADVPGFTNLLLLFKNPLLGMAAGAVLTAVIQSSSASVGILQALCTTGAVSYGAAIPVIMGQNIGTCITAMISAVGANKNAKRAALVHLYFNVIGTMVFMIGFYSFNAFFHFKFLEYGANGAGIAFIHSCFNIGATILLLPFSRGLEKLACLTVKDNAEEKKITETEKELQTLDVRFLETPGLAIAQCRHVSAVMAGLARNSLQISFDLFRKYDKAREKEVLQMEKEVDQFEDKLGTYLLKLGAKNLSEKDSHLLNIILHCIGDFERISDHAANIALAAREMHKKKLSFSNRATEELQIYTEAVNHIVNMTMEAFEYEDKKLACCVEPMEEVIDELGRKIKNRHIKRLRKGKCTIEMGFVLSDIMNNYERVSDHCSNIAVCILQGDEEQFDTHEYLHRVKTEDNTEFTDKVSEYRERYKLPSKEVEQESK